MKLAQHNGNNPQHNEISTTQKKLQHNEISTTQQKSAATRQNFHNNGNKPQHYKLLQHNRNKP